MVYPTGLTPATGNRVAISFPQHWGKTKGIIAWGFPFVNMRQSSFCGFRVFQNVFLQFGNPAEFDLWPDKINQIHPNVLAIELFSVVVRNPGLAQGGVCTDRRLTPTFVTP